LWLANFHELINAMGGIGAQTVKGQGGIAYPYVAGICGIICGCASPQSWSQPSTLAGFTVSAVFMWEFCVPTHACSD
jgi:hypothetical protein